MQDYETILDPTGEQIHPGSIVKPVRDTDGTIEVPGGVVTKLTEMDVDADEDGTHRYGPHVYVTHDDGTEERYDVTDTKRITWADYMMPPDYEWVCEDIEVETLHNTRVQRNHKAGRPGQADYRAHCTCGWRSLGGLTEQQAEAAASHHSPPQSCGEANRQAAESAHMIRHAEWLESQGHHSEAADIRRDYPF